MTSWDSVVTAHGREVELSDDGGDGSGGDGGSGDESSSPGRTGFGIGISIVALPAAALIGRAYRGRPGAFAGSSSATGQPVP